MREAMSYAARRVKATTTATFGPIDAWAGHKGRMYASRGCLLEVVERAGEAFAAMMTGRTPRRMSTRSTSSPDELRGFVEAARREAELVAAAVRGDPRSAEIASRGHLSASARARLAS